MSIEIRGRVAKIFPNFIFLSLVSIYFLLGGCTSVESVPNNYALNANSEKGLLLVSMTYQGSYSGYSMKFNKIGSSDLESLEIGTGTAILPPGMHDWDIKGRGLRGNVFAVELSPGDYEFSTWSVSSGKIHVHPENSFSIKFKITPGQAIYVGNFNFVRKSGFGAAVTSVDVSRNDALERDIPILKSKYSNLEASQFSIAIEKNSSEHWIGGKSSMSVDPMLIIPAK